VFCRKEINVTVICGDVIVRKALYSATIIIFILFYRETPGDRYNILLFIIIIALCEVIRNLRYDTHKELNFYGCCNSNSFRSIHVSSFIIIQCVSPL